jgi:hypothetical protein
MVKSIKSCCGYRVLVALIVRRETWGLTKKYLRRSSSIIICQQQQSSIINRLSQDLQQNFNLGCQHVKLAFYAMYPVISDSDDEEEEEWQDEKEQCGEKSFLCDVPSSNSDDEEESEEEKVQCGDRES